MTEPLFQVEGLSVALPDPNRKALFGRRPMVTILNDISFAVEEGTVVGVVGESGSGKTTLGRTLVRLIEPAAGSHPLRRRGHRPSRRGGAAAAPPRPAGDLPGPALLAQSAADRRHDDRPPAALPRRGDSPRREARSLAAEALETVGLPPAFAARYPHELSGGQRQRVGIARAIATKPRFVLADEIVSGLDVSSQAQILRLLEQLKSELRLTVLFISHDLSVVRRLCDRVIVMRRGEILENRPTGPLFDAPEHPYTAELKAAIPCRRSIPAGSSAT